MLDNRYHALQNTWMHGYWERCLEPASESDMDSESHEEGAEDTFGGIERVNTELGVV